MSTDWPRVKKRYPIGASFVGTVAQVEPFGFFLVSDDGALAIVDLGMQAVHSRPIPRDYAYWPGPGERIRGYVVRHRDDNRQLDIVWGNPAPTTTRDGEIHGLACEGVWTDPTADHSRSTWLSIAHYLVLRLSERYACDFVAEPDQKISTGRGFSLECRASGSYPTPPTLSFRAVVGAKIVEDQMVCRAHVFHYAGDERLVGELGTEFLELGYFPNRVSDAWQVEGWRSGEIGEWDDFKTFRTPTP